MKYTNANNTAKLSTNQRVGYWNEQKINERQKAIELAKEQHTENMINLVENNKELEKYDLLNNQGYGTKKHREAIAEHGLTPQHRRSFAPCKNYLLQQNK